MTEPLARHFVRGVFLVAIPAVGGRFLFTALGDLGQVTQVILTAFAVLILGLVGTIGVLHLVIAGLLAFGIIRSPPRLLAGPQQDAGRPHH